MWDNASMGKLAAGAAAISMMVGVIVGRITAPEQMPDEHDVADEYTEKIAVPVQTIPVPRNCDTITLVVHFADSFIETDERCDANDGSPSWSGIFYVNRTPLNQEPVDPSQHAMLVLELVPRERLDKP